MVMVRNDCIPIRTANLIPYRSTAKFMFVGVRNNEIQQIRRKINRIHI